MTDRLDSLSGDEFQQVFDEVVEAVGAGGNESTPQDVKLKFYGLYKQVTCGSANPADKPSMFNVTGSKKFGAWMEYKDQDKEDCQRKYMRLAAEQSSTEYGRKAAELIQ